MACTQQKHPSPSSRSIFAHIGWKFPNFHGSAAFSWMCPPLKGAEGAGLPGKKMHAAPLACCDCWLCRTPGLALVLLFLPSSAANSSPTIQQRPLTRQKGPWGQCLVNEAPQHLCFSGCLVPCSHLYNYYKNQTECCLEI